MNILKSGGGRKKLKPECDAGKNLKEQMESAVALYDSEMSLQAIGEELGLNPIKVRKLLITAGVYESEVAEKVQATFQEYRETQDYKTSILSTANTLKLSKASVTSYLPYRKGVYFTWVHSSVGSYRSHHITISSSFTDVFLPSWSRSTSIRLALRRLCYRRYLLAGMYPSEVHTFLIWQVRGDGGFGKVKRLCG